VETDEPNQASAEEQQRRALSFGAAARQYDRARPTYHPQLIDDIVTLLPGRDVVEVGAGTGKATTLFVERRLTMTCLEPDAEMAGILAENCPGVEIVVTGLEDWQPSRTYDGLVAAQSWHWTQPASRYLTAAQTLHEGGLLALFWNHTQTHLTPLLDRIAELYERHGVASEVQKENAANSREPEPWPGDELEKLTTFTAVKLRAYFSEHDYSADEWCGYAASTSDLLIVSADQRRRLLADLHALIENDGDGVLHIHRRADLYLARRNGAPPS